jgi:mRNA interferase MazF
VRTQIDPQQGEIWYVDLEPTRGAEMRKTRPCLVVSAVGIGRLPIRIIVPITGWQTSFEDSAWLVKIEPTPENGLSKTSAADTLQIRGVDLSRFVDSERAGYISDAILQMIVEAVTLLLSVKPSIDSPDKGVA